mgnify:CR=1 FL=1
MSKNETLVKDQETVLAELNTKFVYVLSLKNDVRGRVYDADGNPIKDPEYPARRNLLLRSSIAWPGGTDPFSKKQRPAGKYFIRYYDSCTTLFVDDQPKDTETINQLVAATRELHFIKGFLEVYGYETILKNYLDWCSWNEESPYRITRVDAVFKLLDTDRMRKAEAAQMDEVEKALSLAKTATVKRMRVHARFLDIADVDLQTMQPLSDEAIRVEYRKAAMHMPEHFIRTYSDESLHIKVWVENSLAKGEISTTIVPNRAVWAKTGEVICDYSGIQTKEGILNKIIEFAQTEPGAEFKGKLEALNK